MRLTSLAAGLLALLLVAPAFAQDPIRIVAAENFYGDVARQIGGDHVQVTSILSNPDQDPHLFETSPSAARALADAAIVVYNGADYDPWMDKLLSAGGAPERTSIVAATLIGAKPGDNPHLWYVPATLPRVAKALADALAARDPANAADYAANLGRFEAGFEAVTVAAAAVKASYAGTPVTATEPVFGYMASAMGLEMLNGDFQLAVMNGTEPSSQQVADFETSIKTGRARLLFHNSQVSDPTSERLVAMAKDAGIPVIGVTETEPAGETIQTWFLSQIGAVATALAATKP